MAVTLKASPFESAMAVAPPLVCGMTPLGTEVSSARQPLWGLSTATTAGERRLHLLQMVLEDMAIICRVRHISEIPNEGNKYVTGMGGNSAVIWVTGWTHLGDNDYGNGRLYDINPRDFAVRRSVLTPPVGTNDTRPLHVSGDSHTVWIYNSTRRDIYKMSAVTFAVQRRDRAWSFLLGGGDRYGVWVGLYDTRYPSTQQVRLVYYNADFIKEVDVIAPLWQYGPTGRRLLGVAGTGGKDPATGRDRALICKTGQEDEGVRLHLLDASDFSVLRSTLEFRGQYGSPGIGGGGL